LSRALLKRDIKKGDKVALMSSNRPEWNFCDFGAMQLGVAIVPLYPTLSEQDLNHILTDADVKLIFVSNKELYGKLKRALDSLSTQIEVISFDAVEGTIAWEDFLKTGDQGVDLEIIKNKIDEDDLLTLIYTSGTTGK